MLSNSLPPPPRLRAPDHFHIRIEKKVLLSFLLDYFPFIPIRGKNVLIPIVEVVNICSILFPPHAI